MEPEEIFPTEPSKGPPLPRWLAAKWPEVERQIVEIAPELAGFIGDVSPQFLYRALYSVRDRKVNRKREKEELLASIIKAEEWLRTHQVLPMVEEIEEIEVKIRGVKEWLVTHPEAPREEILKKRETLEELQGLYREKARLEAEIIRKRLPEPKLLLSYARGYPPVRVPPPGIPQPMHWLARKSLEEESIRVGTIDRELARLDALEVSIMNMLMARARRMPPPTER